MRKTIDFWLFSLISVLSLTLVACDKIYTNESSIDDDTVVDPVKSSEFKVDNVNDSTYNYNVIYIK